MGHRERKKLETRQALSAAALRLAAEHGPENVRVEQIAAVADVSPRTYNNYFSSREEAICAALGAERALRIGTAVRARPAGESLATAVIGALVAEYSRGGLDEAMINLITSSAALESEYLRTTSTFDLPLAEAMAARLGVDQGLAIRAMATALTGAVRVAAERWLGDGSVPLPELVTLVLANFAPALDALENNS